MNTVDYIVLAFLVISMGLGWVRGFLRTIIKPVSWLLCLYLGYAYYMRTQSLIISFVISLVGPFVVKFLLTALIEILQKSGKKEGEKTGLSFLSRILGLGMSGVWMAFLIGIVYFMVGIIPFKIPGFEPFRNRIVESRSYIFFSHSVGKQFPRLAKVQQTSTLDFSDPETAKQFDVEKLQSSSEFKNLMEHPQVQSLFQDETFQERIRNGQVMGIMEDKRVKEILQDPQVMKDFFSFYNRLIQMAPAGLPAEDMLKQPSDDQ